MSNANPRCPVCNRRGEHAGHIWRCPAGHGFFDGDDEGIVSNHTDPAKAAEQKELFELRRKQRTQRR